MEAGADGCVETKDADALPKHLLLKYARQADRAALFNYASMAHNNHFFFNALVWPTARPVPPVHG
jgi:hypothetical protein